MDAKKTMAVVAMGAWLLAACFAFAEAAQEGAPGSDAGEGPGREPDVRKRRPHVPIVGRELLLFPRRSRRQARNLAGAARQPGQARDRQWQPISSDVSFYDPVNGYYYYPGARPNVVTILVGPPDNPVAMYYYDAGVGAPLAPQYYRDMVIRMGKLPEPPPAGEFARAAEEAPPPAAPSRRPGEGDFPSRLSPMFGGPPRVPLLFAIGETKLRQGKFGEALSAFHRCCSSRPEDGASRIGVSLAWLGVGRYDVAAERLREGLGLIADWDEIRLEPGRAFGRPQAYQAVLAGLQEARRNDSSNEDVALLLGFHYFASARHTEAADLLKAARDADAQDPLIAKLLLAVEQRQAAEQAKAEEEE